MQAEAKRTASSVQKIMLVMIIRLELTYSSKFIRDSSLNDRVQYLVENILWTLKKLIMNS